MKRLPFTSCGIVSSLLQALTLNNDGGNIIRDLYLVALHECCEKYEWWLNELLSLGLAVHRRNEFNDLA